MENLLLAVALLCQERPDYWNRSYASRDCASEILLCYAKENNPIQKYTKGEIERIAQCIKSKKK